MTLFDPGFNCDAGTVSLAVVGEQVRVGTVPEQVCCRVAVPNNLPLVKVTVPIGGATLPRPVAVTVAVNVVLSLAYKVVRLAERVVADGKLTFVFQLATKL